ncbi:MAG: hypothetical protein AWU57_3737 [Marinobacter sp. T13-3]|nr:MAG: hypothetical protein AWU57_3737 [Marinobacter sp. T13-3]
MKWPYKASTATVFPLPLRLHYKTARVGGVKSVVIPKQGDEKSVIRDFVDHAVLFVNSAGPVTSEAMFERFRFTDTFERFALGFLDQLVDSIKDFFISFLPVQIVFPGVLGEDEFHSRSSFS